MGATILVCPCGRRLKATPGESGRCPACGRSLRAPAPASAPPPPPEAVSDDDVWEMLQGTPEVAAAEPAAAPVVEDDEWNWRGTYDLAPDGPPDRAPDEPKIPDNPASPVEAPETADDERARRGAYELGPSLPAPTPTPTPARAEPRGPVADAELRPTLAPRGRAAEREPEDDEPRRPEPWWPPRLLYPARGVEGLGMVAVIGVGAWVMGALVPEYCLAILADAEQMGVPTLGRLIALISALPVLIPSPLVVVYGLRYLARVMAASSDGEPLPPRPPDRNIDGLLDGAGAWLLWMALGAGVGLLPLAAYGAAMTWSGGSWNPVVVAALGLAGLPYALMALMMTFLRDDDPAARPGAVLGAIARLGPSFLGLCLTVAGLCASVGIAFAAALALRDRAFPAYLLANLACWLLAAWLAIVAMHTLGTYHAAREGVLKWRRKRRRRRASDDPTAGPGWTPRAGRS